MLRTLVTTIRKWFARPPIDYGTLPAHWTPSRNDLRRHNREIREIRG